MSQSAVAGGHELGAAPGHPELLTVEQFLELHPWPQRMSEVGPSLDYLWHFELTATPQQLWPHMIETSRFNRALGLSRFHYEERDGVLYGSTKHGGVAHDWVEVPWSWVAGREIIAARHYSRGFARWVRSIYRIDASPNGSVVHVYFGWITRGFIGRSLLKLGVPLLKKGYTRMLDTIAVQVDELRPEPYVVAADQLQPEAQRRLEKIGRELGSTLPPELVHKVIELITTGDDMDVHRIQVRRLARDWDADERALLSVFLHATRAGLFELTWDVICPHCRGVRDQTADLAAVRSDGACEVCEVTFGTGTENALEITFHVHPSIREVPKLYYCAAEPSTKLHIKLQMRLHPSQQRSVQPHLSPGRYRMRMQGAERIVCYIDIGDARGADVVNWPATGHLDACRLGADPTFALHNDTLKDQSFIIEELAWGDHALRPVHLFSFQEFRDLFSDDYVSTDVQISVGNQTLVFTDIVGSTKFYASRGDPEAFMEVKGHFEEIHEVVAANGGAVVKTIGDAVMAAFSNPLDAVRASKAIHECFPRDREDSPIRLRISLNSGPCIAVNLNSGIDYFGGTVNIAAKLQAFAETGQIAMSDTVYASPAVREYLDARGAELKRMTFESEALGKSIPVYQWTT